MQIGQAAVKVKIHFCVVNSSSWELDIKWTEKFKMPISGAFQIHMYLYIYIYIFSIDRCREMQWPGNNGTPLAS